MCFCVLLVAVLLFYLRLLLLLSVSGFAIAVILLRPQTARVLKSTPLPP